MSTPPPIPGSSCSLRAPLGRGFYCIQVLIDTYLEDGSQMKLVQYGVPTRPGWCRLMLCQASLCFTISGGDHCCNQDPRHVHKNLYVLGFLLRI